MKVIFKFTVGLSMVLFLLFHASCKEEEVDNIAVLVEGNYVGYLIDEQDTTYGVNVQIERIANDKVKVFATTPELIFTSFSTKIFRNFESVITSDINSGVSLAAELNESPIVMGFNKYDTGQEFRGSKQ